MSNLGRSEGLKVLVTGFGPFLDISNNPSWEIARNLPPTISHDETVIKLIVPEAPLSAAYHSLLETAPKLISEHDPVIVLQIGLAVDQEHFSIERSAPKEGYHEIPDNNRRVITRAENKKLFVKKPQSLASSLDLDTAFSTLSGQLYGLTLPSATSTEHQKAKGKQKGKPVDVQLTDNVGNYVCGFVYYLSMLEMEKRGKRRDVVFLHVPMLKGEGEVAIGVKVVVELVKSLVEVWKSRP